jgi:hypothetical protein
VDGNLAAVCDGELRAQFLFLKKCEKPISVPKIIFWQFPRKASILKYMLLHNSYIIMVIAKILHNLKSLYDHQGPRNKIFDTLKRYKWALHGPFSWVLAESSNHKFFHGLWLPLLHRFYAGL